MDNSIVSRTLSQEKHFQIFNYIFQKLNRRLKGEQQQNFELPAEQYVPPLIAEDRAAQGDELAEPALFTAWGPEIGHEYSCRRKSCHSWTQGDEISCVCSWGDDCYELLVCAHPAHSVMVWVSKWTPLTIPKPFHKTHVNAEERIQSTNAFPQLPIPAHWSSGLTSNWQVL